MRKFINFINKFPLIGKVSIRQEAFLIYTSTSKGKRGSHLVVFYIMMLMFMCGHGYQAAFGMKSLLFNAHFFIKLGFLFYAIINFMAVLSHVDIIIRIINFTKRKTYTKIKRQYRNYAKGDFLKMAIITLCGQIIFLIFYFVYRN
jgi:hypothetical protein